MNTTQIYDILKTIKKAKNINTQNYDNNVYRNLNKGKKINDLLSTPFFKKVNLINKDKLLAKHQKEEPEFLGELYLLLTNPHHYLLKVWNQDINKLSKLLGVIYED